MSFKYLSDEAEELLSLVISERQNIFTYSVEEFSDSVREKHLLAKELQEANCCDYTGFIGGGFALQLKPDGNNYFKNKKRYEEQNQNHYIKVTATNNSSVNFNTGSGQAIQNISIYTVEQHTALNEFREAVNASSDLNDGQKNEILELLAAMEESKAQNRTFTFSFLVNRINEIVVTSKTLHAIWTGVTTLFS